MHNDKLKVVMLVGSDQSSRIMYHGICSDVDIKAIVLEDKASAQNRILQRRIKRLGIVKVCGQILFILANKVLSRFSQTKIDYLLKYYELNTAPFPDTLLKKVDNVNHKEISQLLQEINPGAVVVNGTRILSEEILSSVDVPFINTHMGITPKYRGVYGGYWALAKGDSENCGVTVHLVDKGVDTGAVLYQERIDVGQSDNVNTYPIHQIAKAIPLMRSALQDVHKGLIQTKEGIYPSKLWYHPTLFEYLRYRIKDGVK